MIAGLSLPDLAQKIVDDAKANRDFIADTSKVTFDYHNAAQVMEFSTSDSNLIVTPTRLAQQQIATHTDIPWKYWERMAKDAPSLLAVNVNRWFSQEPAPRMLRTRLNGTSILRAFLSNKYRPLDNATLAEMCIPILTRDGWHIESAQVTETKFYLQAVNSKLTAEIVNSKMCDLGTSPDRVKALLTIGNSEVGNGSLYAQPGIFREWCKNGATTTVGLRRSHIGKALMAFGGSGDASEYFTDSTRQLTDAAIWSQLRDVISGSGNADHFSDLVAKIHRAADAVIEARPKDVVEVLAKQHGFSESESDSVLTHLIRNGDMSLWGISNAVSETANTLADYDRAVELQRFSGDALDLSVPTLLRSISKN